MRARRLADSPPWACRVRAVSLEANDSAVYFCNIKESLWGPSQTEKVVGDGTAHFQSCGGGERFDIEKSKELFAVKKRAGTMRGSLTDALAQMGDYPSVKFQETDSFSRVEVYRVGAESLDEAMEIIRLKKPGVKWCSHVYNMHGDDEGAMVPTDCIYMEVKPGADASKINKVLDELGLELMPMEGSGFLLRLTDASFENPIKIANALAERGDVELAEPDFSMKVCLHGYRPLDTLFPQQWHLENRGGFGLIEGADVSAPDAWEITRGDRSIVVCVMDDGVQLDHPDFSSPGKILSPFDFGQNDDRPAPVFSSDNHGTACAGVAVADENETGVVGMAPGCALMPIRTSGTISDSTIDDLFEYARVSGADVISCSWGVATRFFTLSTRMKNAIRRAALEGRNGKGCVILFAAGNENSPVDGVKDGVRVRSGFARHPEVITISASNSRDVRSTYSNFGPEIWVAAPSSGAGGRRIVTTDRTGAAGYQSGAYTTVEGFGGTSSSTPLVAGVCGLMLSVNPDLTSTDVKEILGETADKIDADNGNYNPEGHSKWYGWGRVNAFRAVSEARNRLSPSPVKRITFERTPGLAVPDFPLPGVSDAIQVEDAGIVRSASVSVDITHTFRGDLRILLVTPDGSRITLRDRKMDGRNNVVHTYTAEGTAALSVLSGKPARGSWELRVIDMAKADTGIVNSWTLTLDLEPESDTVVEATPGMLIPDNDPVGIVSEIQVDHGGPLGKIELTVDITHSWQGDLSVTLETPGGVSASLHQLTGGSTDNLKKTYSALDTDSLAALVDAGVAIRGTWKLLVSDHASADVGKLNAWKLVLGS